MVTLRIYPRTPMNQNLFNQWPVALRWRDWVTLSSPGILAVEYYHRDNITEVAFESEEHMNWFLLKWS